MGRGYIFENDCRECKEASANGIEERCVTCTAKENMIFDLAARWNDLNMELSERDSIEKYEYISRSVWSVAADNVERLLSGNRSIPFNDMELERLIVAEYDRLWEERNRKQDIKHQEMQLLEQLMSKLGARMMRPYEHWNEEEHIMQYLETRWDHEYIDDDDY